MFDSLKKKFASFIDSITKKEEAAAGGDEAKAALKESPDTGKNAVSPPSSIPPEQSKQKEADKGNTSAGTVQEKIVAERSSPETAMDKGERSKATETRAYQHSIVPDEGAEHAYVHAQNRARPEANPSKVTLGTRLKGILLKEVRVSPEDVEPFLEQLRISLLQSDVNYDVAEKLLGRIEEQLTSNPIESKDLQRNITEIIRASVLSVLGKTGKIDIVKLANNKRGSGEPLRILFVGPNGAGKTTAMAKLAKILIDNGFTCVLSASDTFRAAAIEQTAYHAARLGIPVIKGLYGADPASVAFDAIAYAKAHETDVVLIDSAGRQETNKSLMEEIKKMVRVAQPDLKIFVGESVAGNALLNQVREFDQAIKLDGIILTKLDADAKGGNTLSILSETEVPVLFFGTGEAYDAIMAYKPEFILDNIIPNN
ncbi:MAG: signal recognition particle-docking protein FtsY [Candidatus Micrarchaeaceae archaeon]